MLQKVSILIPTYNRPEYFEQALQSALAQTYPHIEIVICDNSDNDCTEKIANHYMTLHPSKIKYFRNHENLGPVRNQQKCYDLSTGEYINYLMDDDLFRPHKIERMMHYFLNCEGITLVTSHRQTIDQRGSFLPMDGAFKRLYEQDTIMDGIEFGNLVMSRMTNYIGEPTTVLFRREDLDEPFGVFAGRQAQNNVDVASWLTLCKKGKAVYIAETLSYTRIHPHQLSQTDSWNTPLKGRQDWIEMQSQWWQNILPIQMNLVMREVIETPMGTTGHLDRMSVEGDTIVGEGWARDPRTGTPAKEIIIVNQEGTICARTNVGHERPDVSFALRDRRMMPSGWFVQFNTNVFPPGNHVFHAYLVCDDGLNGLRAFRLQGECNVELGPPATR